MRLLICCTLILFYSCSSKNKISKQNVCQQLQSKYELLSSPKKVILVLTSSWNSSQAIATLWTKNIQNEWKQEGKGQKVMIGRSGLGLGLDWYSLKRYYKSAPLKKEGDGKTPFGLYLLGKKFGKLPAKDYNQHENYIEINEGTQCVDDVDSPYYSRIVETKISNAIVTPNWKSSEIMFEQPLYQQGVVIDYETKSSERSGSCIFMHLEDKKADGTAGCIATPKNFLDKVFEFSVDYEEVMIAIMTTDFYEKNKQCILIN